MTRRWSTTGALIALMGVTGLTACGGSSGTTASQENYLFVNVGAEGGANDQIAIIDAKAGSATFGKIIRMIDLGSKYNEPHHTGKSADGTVGYFMGLFLPGRIWSMDLTQPIMTMAPKVILADAAMTVNYNNPDEFVPLSDGTFLVSFMGSAMATTPGAIAMFDKGGTMMSKFEVDKASMDAKAYNPHGFDVRTDIKRMANGNFISPANAAGLSGTLGADYRGGLTVWSFDQTAKTAQVIHTYDLSSGMMAHDGIMDVKMIPNDPQGRVLATNMRGGELWLATTIEPFSAKAVYTGLQYPQLIQMTKDGKTIFVTSYADNMVHKFDISDPEHPKLLGEIVGPKPDSIGGTPSGAHYCKLSSDEQRLYVTSYFINLQNDVMLLPKAMQPPMDNVASYPGVRQLWALTTADMKVVPNFDVDFSQKTLTLADGSTLSGGPFGPHGVILDK